MLVFGRDSMGICWQNMKAKKTRFKNSNPTNTKRRSIWPRRTGVGKTWQRNCKDASSSWHKQGNGTVEKHSMSEVGLEFNFLPPGPRASTAPEVLTKEYLWWLPGVVCQDPPTWNLRWFHVGDQNTTQRKYPAETARGGTPHILYEAGKGSMNQKKNVIYTTVQLCLLEHSYCTRYSPKFMYTQNLWMWPYLEIGFLQI